MKPAGTTAKATLKASIDGSVLYLCGEWTVFGIAELSAKLESFQWPSSDNFVLDLSNASKLDSAGAWLLITIKQRLSKSAQKILLQGGSDEQHKLLELVEHRMDEYASASLSLLQKQGFVASVGQAAWNQVEQFLSLLAFIGENSVVTFRSILLPTSIRWKTVVNNLQQVGVNALPIIGLLSFLLGIVIAYQGGVQLRQYGANIFVVELINLTMLRELSPMMAAIIVAGRSGSAFTAQIGTMKVSEEVDALRSIGISPLEMLVTPKLFALIIALPLLTVYADLMGVFGGMVMAAVMLDISFSEFIARTPDAVSLTSFLLGIGKAPVFAVVIVLVGCFQGFRVSGGADSVGRNTTMSVVQAIFLIIVSDAAFSIAFSWLGI